MLAAASKANRMLGFIGRSTQEVKIESTQKLIEIIERVTTSCHQVYSHRADTSLLLERIPRSSLYL